MEDNIQDSKVYGTFRFFDPDPSVPAEERAIYAGPAPKEAKEETIQLHDFRTASDVAKGFEGLDVQGFTYVKHTSSLRGEEIAQGTNAEDMYAAEIVDLVLSLTGAGHAVVHDITLRTNPSMMQTDLFKVHLRGNEVDQAIMKLPRDKILGLLFLVASVVMCADWE